MLMTSDQPNQPSPEREINGTPLRYVVDRLARRLASESGESHIRALADIQTAVDHTLRSTILLQRVLRDPPTWAAIGADLGVSAQAAHRKYAKIRRPRGDVSALP